MTSVFDLYGYGSPQYGGDSIDASTADVAALYDQQQRYGNSLFGRIDNFLRSKQSQPNQLAADASLWDQAVEAGNRLAHMPVDMLLAGSRTANNWAGSPQFPERVETGDMLAPLGLGAMAGLGAMIPRAALRDRAQAIPAARTPQDVTIVEPVSASQRFRPGDTWEMRSPQWPTSWFEEYHGDGSLPTKIPRSQWDEKTIERAKLFVRDQIARDKANEITDELMWDGRNKVRERWEAEAMAIQDPSKRQILDDAYSARQNWYEHDNPKFMEDPLDWLSYPLPPGTNPVAKIDEMFAVGGKPPDRPPLRDISSALDAPNRMIPDTIPASYFDDIMPAAGAGRAATDLTVPQNRLVRAANDGDDGPLRGSYPSPGNLPLRPSEASSVSLTEAYERYAEKAFQRGLQPDSFERFREAVLDAGIVPQRQAGRSVLPGVELFADQSKASVPGMAANALDMSHEARMQRAKEMGFDTDNVWYHGTDSPAFTSFDRDMVGHNFPDYSTGFHLTNDADVAASYGRRVEPYFVRDSKEPNDIGPAPPGSSIEALIDDYYKYDVEQAIRRGINVYAGRHDGHRQVVVARPEDIRSVNAAFDPAKAGSANLLAADQSRASLPGLFAGAVDERKGFTAYHGSPHDFDRFDMSKIGTGEGAQAYGHGLYFAENPKVARAYDPAKAGSANLLADIIEIVKKYGIAAAASMYGMSAVDEAMASEGP